jgi:uncharacterized protein
MRQDWHHLLFLHWQVPAAQLRPLVPAELEIDTFDGAAYVGLVPFTMTGVRPVFTPSIPPLSDFHEINVRTYVHLRGADPGVWFFSLDAANAIAVRLARALYKLPYFCAKMALHLDPPGGLGPESGLAGEARQEAGPWIDYETDRLWPDPLPASCRVRYRSTGAPSAAAVGSLEHFLVERYILYAHDRRRLYRGRVHHQRYPLQPAACEGLTESLTMAAGIRHGDEAPLAHYARTVNVQIYPLERA